MKDSEKATYERRLRHRLTVLKKEFEAGNIKINSDLQVIESLKAIQYGVDGEIDLDSVDGSVRSLALAVEAVHTKRETKEAMSLRELQQGYFRNIESIFGNLYRDMTRDGTAPFQVGSAISRDPEGVRIFHKAIPNIVDWTASLWEQAHDIAHIHVEDTNCLKSVFGGETFPQGYKNIVSCTGIYVDTNILPDPFLRSRFILEGNDKAAAVRSFITSGLSLLHYKDAALADIEVPLAAIVPDLLYLDDEARERVFRLAERDAATHLSAMFGIEFSEQQEAQDFLSKFETSRDVVARLAAPSLLLFDVDDKGPIEDSIDDYIRNFFEPFGKGTHAGMAVFASIVGRMRQANDLLTRSSQLGGSPLIDAPTSWRYFNWKLGYGHTPRDPAAHRNLHIAKALQTAALGEMQWLGAVPVSALIEMRKQNALPELREMLAGGIQELVELRPDNFFRTGDQVLQNIQRAFDEHRAKLSTLTGKKWRFAGIELGSCTVKGAVEIASACGVPIVSLIGAALDQVSDVPKIKDIPKRIRSLKDESRQVNGSAVGMLFQIAKEQA